MLTAGWLIWKTERPTTLLIFNHSAGDRCRENTIRESSTQSTTIIRLMGKGHFIYFLTNIIFATFYRKGGLLFHNVYKTFNTIIVAKRSSLDNLPSLKNIIFRKKKKINSPEIRQENFFCSRNSELYVMHTIYRRSAAWSSNFIPMIILSGFCYSSQRPALWCPTLAPHEARWLRAQWTKVWQAVATSAPQLYLTQHWQADIAFEHGENQEEEPGATTLLQQSFPLRKPRSLVRLCNHISHKIVQRRYHCIKAVVLIHWWKREIPHISRFFSPCWCISRMSLS